MERRRLVGVQRSTRFAPDLGAVGAFEDGLPTRLGSCAAFHMFGPAMHARSHAGAFVRHADFARFWNSSFRRPCGIIGDDMSQIETAMVLWYWEQVGGRLIEEFRAVPPGSDHGHRDLDAIILPGEERERMGRGTKVSLEGADVVVVQAKNRRIGMYLMGQTFFSANLIWQRFSPRSVRSVALCARDDAVMRPMLEAYPNFEVVVCPPAVIKEA